jgi:hypothetical protein
MYAALAAFVGWTVLFFSLETNGLSSFYVLLNLHTNVMKSCSRRTDEWDKIYPIRLSVIYPYNHTALARLGSVFETDRRMG